MPTNRRRLIERATLGGLGISVLIHLVLMIIALVVRIDYKFADSGGGGSDPIEFSLISEAELNEQTAINVDEIEFVEIETESLVDLDLLADSGAQQSVNELADTMAPELENGGGSISDLDIQTGSSGAGTGEGASFFGLEASGKRFAYIVDRSGSMNSLIRSGEMSRWELTQIELIRSVQGLSAGAEYFVVLFSTDMKPLFGGSEWIKGTKGNKRLTASAMMASNANGGTDPEDAFRLVFSLEPKPDAIYFMTDGEFNSNVPGRISQMNRRRRVPIHCILLGEPGSATITQKVEGMLKGIARSSNGRYRHVQDVGGAP
jgi:von Willebrand factor type A domain